MLLKGVVDRGWAWHVQGFPLVNTMTNTIFEYSISVFNLLLDEGQQQLLLYCTVEVSK